MKTECLDECHFKELGWEYWPDHYIGFATRKEGRVIALGVVFLDEDDKWFAMFDSVGDCVRSVHKNALKVKQALILGGVDFVYAKPDPNIDRAEAWLERLGFECIDEEWRLDLGLDRVGYRRGVVNRRGT